MVYNRNLKQQFNCIDCNKSFIGNPQARPKYCDKCRRENYLKQKREYAKRTNLKKRQERLNIKLFICKRCKQEISKTKDKQTICEDCKNTKKLNTTKKWRNENIVRRKEYCKEYFIKNRDKKIKYQEEYVKKYPKKVKAQAKARYEISLIGKVCEDCGAKGRLERHHPDYSKPLEVKILCPQCHTNIHRGKNDNLEK